VNTSSTPVNGPAHKLKPKLRCSAVLLLHTAPSQAPCAGCLAPCKPHGSPRLLAKLPPMPAGYKRFSYPDAQAICQMGDANLASVASAEENGLLAAWFLVAADPPKSFWIGGALHHGQCGGWRCSAAGGRQIQAALGVLDDLRTGRQPCQEICALVMRSCCQPPHSGSSSRCHWGATGAARRRPLATSSLLAGPT
jgi:hypothetical protein